MQLSLKQLLVREKKVLFTVDRVLLTIGRDVGVKQ